MPALPDSNAVCALLVSVDTAPGCTTFAPQNRSLNQFTAVTEASEFTAGVYLAPSVVEKTPPAGHRELAQKHGIYPRGSGPRPSHPHGAGPPLAPGALGG